MAYKCAYLDEEVVITGVRTESEARAVFIKHLKQGKLTEIDEGYVRVAFITVFSWWIGVLSIRQVRDQEVTYGKVPNLS